MVSLILAAVQERCYNKVILSVLKSQDYLFSAIGMGAAIPLQFPSTQFWSLPVVTTVAEEAGENARLIAYGMFLYSGGVV